jgi:hypothetical protein
VLAVAVAGRCRAYRDLEAAGDGGGIVSSPFWSITFRAEDDGIPVEVRVRRLLKSALRAHGLVATAVKIEQEKRSPTHTAGETSKGGGRTAGSGQGGESNEQ